MQNLKPKTGKTYTKILIILVLLLLQLSHIIYYKLWYIIHSIEHKQKYKSSKSYYTNPLDIWYGEVLNKVSSLVLNVLHYLGYINLFQLFIKISFFFLFAIIVILSMTINNWNISETFVTNARNVVNIPCNSRIDCSDPWDCDCKLNLCFCHPHGLEKKFLHNAFPEHLREEKTTSLLKT